MVMTMVIMMKVVGPASSGRAAKTVFFVREIVIEIGEVRGSVCGDGINPSSGGGGTRVAPWAGIGGGRSGGTSRRHCGLNSGRKHVTEKGELRFVGACDL